MLPLPRRVAVEAFQSLSSIGPGSRNSSWAEASYLTQALPKLRKRLERLPLHNHSHNHNHSQHQSHTSHNHQHLMPWYLSQLAELKARYLAAQKSRGGTG